MKRVSVALALGIAMVLVSVACGSDSTPDDATGGAGATGGSGATGSAASEPDDLLAAIEERGYMVAGVSVYAPYIMLDKDNQAIGIFPEMTTEIAKRLGVDVNHVFLSASAFIPALESGRIDTLSGYSFTDERAEVADFSSPVMYLPDCFMVEKSSGITSIEDLNDKVIGLTRGSVGEATTNQMIENGLFTPKEIKTYDTFESPVQEIVNGRIDAGYWDVVGFQYGAEQNPETFSNIDCFPITPEQMGVEDVLPVYYLFPKGEDRLLETVNGIIADMTEDGTIAEIFSHYGLTDPHLVTGFADE